MVGMRSRFTACKRGVFTAIDPDTVSKGVNREPLRTMSKLIGARVAGDPSFGVHLSPWSTGVGLA